MILAREFDFEVDDRCTKVYECWEEGEVEVID